MSTDDIITSYRANTAVYSATYQSTGELEHAGVCISRGKVGGWGGGGGGGGGGGWGVGWGWGGFGGGWGGEKKKKKKKQNEKKIKNKKIK